MLKIFIPSWRRSDCMMTPKLLDECGVRNYKVIVREYEYSEYAKTTRRKNLVVIGDEDGVNVAREAARGYLKKGEWCLQLDDNVRGFIMPKLKFYKNNSEIKLKPGENMATRAAWQSTLSVRVSFSEFYKHIVEDSIEEAEERDSFIVGFSNHENPAFRAKKFSDVGYVCGKVQAIKNQKLAWNQSNESACEDYALTAAHLFVNGRVLINKWGHPLRTHYQKGGNGPYEERLPAMLRAQGELIERFDGLFAVKKSKTREGELRLRFYSMEQVEKWRASFKDSPVW